MLYRRRRLVVSEIDRYCRSALMAYGDAAQALRVPDLDRLWFSLEALVASARHIHQFLWPLPDPRVDWAVELRAALAIGDESPLNGSALGEPGPLARALESWTVLKPGGGVVLTNFGPSGFSEPSPANCVRCFSPPSGRFTWFGVVYETTSILGEVAALAPRAAGELENLRTMV